MLNNKIISALKYITISILLLSFGISAFAGPYADQILIDDVGGKYAGDNVEEALQEVDPSGEANVQSDWDQVTDTEDDYIKNKPTTITAQQATDITTNNAKITYPSADSTKVGHISVTQAVDLDTIESDTLTNNAR